MSKYASLLLAGAVFLGGVLLLSTSALTPDNKQVNSQQEAANTEPDEIAQSQSQCAQEAAQKGLRGAAAESYIKQCSKSK